MAGRIRQEDVQAVRERTDIVQVVSGYLQLKKTGRDALAGLCPFHPEKTPSFSVSPSKQVYHCFGCGEGGDVFTFLMKLETLSFSEAVERLAGPAGVTLRFEGQTAGVNRSQGRRQTLHRAIAEAARLYHRMLLEGREATEARAYLQRRGISETSVERFSIGYAPGYHDFLLKRLSRSFSPDLLVEAGLVAKDAGGTLRDRFRGRLMFPVHDVGGNAVGFGGRLVAGSGAAGLSSPPNAPKYLNSPETPVYRKGTLLYSLNRAKGEITRTGRAFVVEGYTDVVALDERGAGTAVATCGTALGEDHIRLLSRFADEVVLAFDSDEAGARAAERAFPFHERYACKLSVLVLPEGQDPADFAVASGGEAFLELARRAVPLVAYMVDRALRGRDLSNIEERARAARAGLSIVAGLSDSVAREEYARYVAGRVGESENAVMLELEHVLAGQGTSEDGVPARPTRGRVSPEEEVEREVLKLMVQAPEQSLRHARQVDGDRFAKPTYRQAFELLAEVLAERGSGVQAAELVTLAGEVRGAALAKLVAALAVEPLKSEAEATNGYAERLFLRLEEFWLKRQADALRQELQRINPEKEPEQHHAMFRQLISLEDTRRRIRAAAESVGSGPSIG